MKAALTGGATGIGAEVARKLLAKGYQVTIFDVSEPVTGNAQWIPTDLSDPRVIAQALDAAGGPFDVLINNAGLPPRAGLEEQILQVNFLGFRDFLEGMLDKLNEGAAIVNVASRAGAAWRENLGQVKALMHCDAGNLAGFIADHGIDPVRAYNLSKEAVIALTLAQTERMVGRGIRMNVVSPAAVSTGILKDFEAAFGEKVAHNIRRAGRAGKPDEIADVIVYLASPASAWIKGQDIVIDGGMTAMAISDALGLTGNG